MRGGTESYRYAVEVYKREPRRLVGAVRVEPDWEPALEAARFEAARLDADDAIVLDCDSGWIEPVWDARRGRPYLAGVRAVAESPGGRAAVDVPAAYFHESARAASPALVEAGKLEAGEVFEFMACAYASPGARPGRAGADHPADHAARARVAVHPAAQTVPIVLRRLDAVLAQCRPDGEPPEGQLAVVVPRRVIEQCTALMRAAGAAEVGGILLGRLGRDESRRELFVEVTAQIPAEHALHELASLTFTSETWTAADAAIDRRGLDELYLGWWHTHPSGHWCEECPEEKRSRCRTAGKGGGAFFSRQDILFHRTVFPRAYSIALLLSGRCEGNDAPDCRLFGWQRGMVVERPYYVHEARRETQCQAESSKCGPTRP